VPFCSVDACNELGPTELPFGCAMPITNSLFPLKQLQRASLTAEKRSISAYLISQAKRHFLHRPDQAQSPLQATNQENDAASDGLEPGNQSHMAAAGRDRWLRFTLTMGWAVPNVF
jgi:hypothetical protein